MMMLKYYLNPNWCQHIVNGYEKLKPGSVFFGLMGLIACMWPFEVVLLFLGSQQSYGLKCALPIITLVS